MILILRLIYLGKFEAVENCVVLWINILKSVETSVVNWYTVSITKATKLAQIVTAIGLVKMEVMTCKYEIQVLCFQYMLVPKYA